MERHCLATLVMLPAATAGSQRLGPRWVGARRESLITRDSAVPGERQAGEWLSAGGRPA